MDTLLESLNWVDLCLGLMLLGCAMVGFGTGFYRQLALTISLVVGFFVAGRYSSELAATGAFEPVRARLGASGAEASAYALILLAALLVGLTLLLVLRRFFGTGLRLVDSMLGAALGLALGCFAFGCFALGVLQVPDNPLESAIHESMVGEQLAGAARVGARFLPDDVRRKIEASFTKHAQELLAEQNRESTTEKTDVPVKTDDSPEMPPPGGK